MRWRRILLLLAVFGIALGVTLALAARRTASVLVSSLEPVASLTFSSVSVALDGSMRLQEPRLIFHFAGWQGELAARVADVRGGNAFWLIGQLFSSDTDFADQMSIQTSGLRLAQVDGENALTGWIGSASLVPFENLGCGSDPLQDKDRIRMGIKPAERFDQFGFRLAPERETLRLSMNLRSPGVSEIHGFAELSGFDAAAWKQLSAQSRLRLDRAGVNYEDSGYFAQRNQFCAQWLGTSTAEFIDRHVSAVDEFLNVRGIDPSDDLLAMYQKLITRGGSLGLVSLPEASWAPSEIAAYPRKKLLRELNVTSRLGDAPPIMFRLAFAEPDKPFRFKATEVPSETIFADASELVDSPLLVAAPETVLVEGDDGSPRSTMQDQPPVTADSVASSDSAEEGPASFSSVSEELPADVSAPSTGERHVIASAPPPPKDSILALVWKPGVIERLPQQSEKEKGYRVVSVAALSAYVGGDVDLVTHNGKRVSGVLEQVTSEHAAMRIRVGRGEAELNVLLSQVREVRVPLRN